MTVTQTFLLTLTILKTTICRKYELEYKIKAKSVQTQQISRRKQFVYNLLHRSSNNIKPETCCCVNFCYCSLLLLDENYCVQSYEMF